MLASTVPAAPIHPNLWPLLAQGNALLAVTFYPHFFDEYYTYNPEAADGVQTAVHMKVCVRMRSNP